MISANETTDIVRFLESEAFNSEILSDQPPSTPAIEGRSPSPPSTPSIANLNGHALLSPMDPEAPPSSLPSNVTTEPASKLTGTKSKKKNQTQKTQKPQSSIQQFLAPPTTPKARDWPKSQRWSNTSA